MRNAGAKRVHYDSGPNMTPLVDVVMVILIFLMLAGSFGSAEHFIASRTPVGKDGPAPVAKPNPNDPLPVNLDVRVSDNGNFTLTGELEGGRMVVMSSPEMLKQKLEARLAQLPDKKNVQVILRPTPTTRWDSLVPLYDAALRAKYEKVTFAMAGS